LNIKSVYSITDAFEQSICEYTGSKYCVALDSCSNALFLSLMYENIEGKEVEVPCRTYMSVPCSVIHAGGKVRFTEVEGESIKGAYQLHPTRVIDSSLRFTADMYVSGTFMCLSFSGAYKHLKLIKGGAILTDNKDAYEWFKKSRFSGRNECSYHEDSFTQLGWNFYMLPEIAARGLLLIGQFYNKDGSKKHNEDIELPYPDLSKYEIYNT
jgi:dTDP-4-amino-4,6-dideoxygalactose transaminase